MDKMRREGDLLMDEPARSEIMARANGIYDWQGVLESKGEINVTTEGERGSEWWTNCGRGDSGFHGDQLSKGGWRTGVKMYVLGCKDHQQWKSRSAATHHHHTVM